MLLSSSLLHLKMSYDKWNSLYASFFLSPPYRFLLLHSRCLMTNGIHFMLLSSSRFLLLHSRCLMTNGIHFMLLSSSLLHLKMSYDKWHSLHASFFLSPPYRFLLLHSRCLMTNGIHFMLLSSSLLRDFFYCTQDVL
ncbi:hypothetical protein QL285_027417 [Trifolium repens]|nr:hypothetical protein QL285_027417 [Trifolium repens]